jgi:hypothetical protein
MFLRLSAAGLSDPNRYFPFIAMLFTSALKGDPEILVSWPFAAAAYPTIWSRAPV